MPEVNLPDNGSFTQITRALSDITDSQLRGYSSKGTVSFETKAASLRDEGSVKAFFSGQAKKFEASEKLMLDAIRRETGEAPSKQLQQMVADAVRGRKGQPLNEALEDIRTQMVTEVVDKQCAKVPEGIRAQTRTAMMADAKNRMADGGEYTSSVAERFATRFGHNHATLGDLRGKTTPDDIISSAMSVIRSQGKKDTDSKEKLKDLGDNNDVGRDVFNTIESMNLTAEQKQEIHCRIAEGVVKDECLNPKNDGATLMRENNAGSYYLAAYMDKNATAFNEGVTKSVKEGMGKIQMPKQGATSREVDDGLKNDDKNWTPKFKEAGSMIVDSVEQNVGKMTPNTREFLGRMYASAKNTMTDNGRPTESIAGARVAINNTILLRGALKNVTMDAKLQEANHDPKVKAQGTFLKLANNAALTFGNKSQLPNPKVEKAQDKVANQLREGGGLDKLNKLLDDVGTNPKQQLNQQVAPQKVKDTLKVPVLGSHKVKPESVTPEGPRTETPTVETPSPSTSPQQPKPGSVLEKVKQFEKTGVGYQGVKQPPSKVSQHH